MLEHTQWCQRGPVGAQIPNQLQVSVVVSARKYLYDWAKSLGTVSWTDLALYYHELSGRKLSFNICSNKLPTRSRTWGWQGLFHLYSCTISEFSPVLLLLLAVCEAETAQFWSTSLHCQGGGAAFVDEICLSSLVTNSNKRLCPCGCETEEEYVFCALESKAFNVEIQAWALLNALWGSSTIRRGERQQGNC